MGLLPKLIPFPVVVPVLAVVRADVAEWRRHPECERPDMGGGGRGWAASPSPGSGTGRPIASAAASPRPSAECRRAAKCPAPARA